MSVKKECASHRHKFCNSNLHLFHKIAKQTYEQKVEEIGAAISCIGVQKVGNLAGV